MSDTVYAAVLGLVIPVLGLSVCSRLWRQGRQALRGRKSKKDSKDGLFTVGFAVRVSLLAGACYTFNHMASSMKMEPEHFDPYLILELPSRAANATVIRSQYRRLSLKHHPDKNPGNRAANAQFNKVAKAYQALSDPKARRNWEEYGHPDGYQPWTFDLALPAWLTPSKDTDNATMVLYAVGYMAVLIGFVLSVKLGLDMLDPAGGPKQPVFEVTQEDIQALLNNLDDTSSTEDVLECLAACPQLCSDERRALSAEMESTMKPIRHRLLARGAAPLRAPPGSQTPAAETSTKSSRSGKGKGKSKGGGKGKGSSSGGRGGSEGLDSGNAGEEAGQTEEVEGEFYSKGRQGEGNRKATRSLPELSQVVTHNLVVLLSALYREGVTTGGDVADDGRPEAVGAERDVPSHSESATSAGDGRTRTDGNIDGPVNTAEGQKTLDGDGLTPSPLSTAEAAAELADEQEALFGLAEPLLDACLKVAAQRASPRLFGTVIEAKAMLRRRLWSSEDPEALSVQAREADVDLDAAVPRVKVESVVVHTWGESQVALGDTVTATVTIARDHASEYKGFRKRRPVDGFLSRGEPWWVILSGGKGGETLIAVTPMLVENLGSDVADCKIKFQAPRRPCMMPVTVAVKSPVFVGVDGEGSTTFRVYRHDELKDDDDDAGDW